MGKCISVVIPNYNGSATIGKCIEAALSSRYAPFEVIVVDDCSIDNSVEIISRYPCKLVRLEKHSGASAARNFGVKNCSGQFLFFIDADCLLQKDTLDAVNVAIEKCNGGASVIGGTYTPLPYDHDFFSIFQSIFVNYSETRKQAPDYVATHAMVIDSIHFNKSGGFDEDFLPILEDVEFSHRLHKSGFRLVMDPRILVQHIFQFTIVKSLRNAFRKSMFWTFYSLKNRGLLADSGTASIGLKINGISFCFGILSLLMFFHSKGTTPLLVIPLAFMLNIIVNRGLLLAFLRTKGFFFTLVGTAYYVAVYPLPVLAGAVTGFIQYSFSSWKR
ncbi:MAG TPA: hypothetical protein DCP92_06760 [Nitrospiraceae bacterium]|jgi:glycosyltransferase involved in cell wall biosynthesis|nr:hypothetical protein [Nitrospiraceae bacterium]